MSDRDKTRLKKAKERFDLRFADPVWRNPEKTYEEGELELRAFRRQLNNIIRLAREEERKKK